MADDTAHAPPAPMNTNENTSKYTNDDLDDITLNDVMTAIIANSTGDLDAAAAFELECRKRCDREHLHVGKDTTQIVRAHTDASGEREYTCTITPATRKATLKTPDGAEITLTINDACARFLRDLRAELTGDTTGEGPEIILDETPYIELTAAVAPRITYAQLVGLAAPHIAAAELPRLQRHLEHWTKFKHTHELPDNNGGLHLVACDATGGKLHLTTPSLQCEVSLAARLITISRYDGKDDGGQHEKVHPAPAFFKNLHALLAGTATSTAGDALPYPDEKLFSKKQRNDKKIAQFELWHDTKALNTLLRGLVEKGALVGRELETARNYIRNIAAQSDFYCMLVRGGTIQINCLDAKGAPSQTIMISLAANTVMISAPGAGVQCPLAPEYKHHIAATLTEHGKAGWLK